MKTDEFVTILENAYNICHKMKHHAANVVASGDFGESDEEDLKSSKIFCNWFERRASKDLKEIIQLQKQTAELQKELSDFKALVKQMREEQERGLSHRYKKLIDLETQVDNYLQE